MQVVNCVHGNFKQLCSVWKWKLNVFFWITGNVVMYTQSQKDICLDFRCEGILDKKHHTRM